MGDTRLTGSGGSTGAATGIRGLFRNQAISMLVILIIMWGVLALSLIHI